MATLPFALGVYQCKWIFDLFACGSDHITQYMSPPSGAAGLAALEREVEASHALRLDDAIESCDGEIPDTLLDYLAVPNNNAALVSPPFLWRLFSVLLAIDRAAEGLNHFRYTAPGQWRATRCHMERNGGFLNKLHRPVVLKPPALFPATAGAALWWEGANSSKTWLQPERRGDHIDENFHNLCRVPDIPGCGIEIKRIPLGLGTSDWSVLRIGIVPLISGMRVGGAAADLEPGPLQITRGPNGEFVVGCPKGDCRPPCGACDVLCARVEAAIRHLAKERVQIIAFPEAVVPDPVVRHMQSVLRSLAREGGQFPAVVLAGTYARNDGNGALPRNQAIVLDGRGRELWRQHKMHHYTMQDYEQERYGLSGIFGGKSAPEAMNGAVRHMLFVDVPNQGLRMVAAICEDSAQDDPGQRAIRALRPNLVFIPVMAGALLPRRGFATTAENLAQDPGCITIVANSAALPRAEWSSGSHPPGLPPLGLVGLPFQNVLEGFTQVQVLSTPSTLPAGAEVLTFACP